MKKPSSNAVIRAWAASQGIPCGERGRIPGDVVVAYMAAHGVPVASAEKRLLTVNEAAEVLGYKSKNAVYKLIADGELRVVNLPVRGGTRIDTRDLDVFIERSKRVAS